MRVEKLSETDHPCLLGVPDTVESMNKAQLELIRRYSERQMAKLGLWGWPHVRRVHRLCLCIAETHTEAPVDLEVLEAAALLHDIAKYAQEKGPSVDHGLLGARKAESYLRKCGLEKERIEAASHAIRAHTHSEEPNSVEAKILHDADFLDKLGAVGIATLFIKACLANATIEEVLENYDSDVKKESLVAKHIGWLKKQHLYTTAAREISEKRNEMVTAFFRELKEEVELGDA